MLLNCGVGEDSWESLGLQGDLKSILKEISPGCSLEGLMLKLKLQYFGHMMRRIGKDPDAGQEWGQEEKGTTEDEMVGWHHRLNGHEFGYGPGVGDGQRGLVCCDSWGRKESDTTEGLNWTDSIVTLFTCPSMPIKCSTSRQEYQISYLFHSLRVFQCNWTEVLNKWAFMVIFSPIFQTTAQEV